MRPPFLLAAALVVFALAANANERLGVGLHVPSATTCGEAVCLRIVEGRYHPATIEGAAPALADRKACAAAFEGLIAALSEGRTIERQALYRARRCRSLGLAPVIVPG